MKFWFTPVSLSKNWTFYTPKVSNKKRLTLSYENEQIYRQPNFVYFKRDESGQAAKELSRKYGFHYQTLHDWKKKFSGINSIKELAKIKELASENNLLKKMFVNLSLEHEALKDVLSKK